jgi:hypothetical protein
MSFFAWDAMQHSLIMKLWHLSENGQSFQMCEMVTGTQHCVEADMGAPCVRQLCLILRNVSMTSCFLMELNGCHTGTHGCTECNYLSSVLVHTCCHDRIRMYRRKAQGLRFRGCSDGKPPRKTASLASLLAGSLPSMSTEMPSKIHLHIEMIKQIALCVCSWRLDINNCVCERKMTMQKIMSDGKNCEIVKVGSLCSNINQQVCHFIVPDSVIGFNAP